MKRPRLVIHPSALLLALILAVLDRSLLSLIPTAAAICHECGHLLAMLICRQPVDAIEITLFGAEIRTVSELPLSVSARIFIWGAGAAANLLTGAIAAGIFLRVGIPAIGFFAGCSLVLAALNLLPIPTLDGGCLLAAVLDGLALSDPSKLLAAIGGAATFLLWLLSIWFCLYTYGNLSLMLFCVYLFATLWLHPSAVTDS